MKRLPTLVLLAALLPCAWIAPAPAQPSRPAADLTLAQAERMASDLKYGMSADEVRKLLGKPRRTALRPNGLSTTAPWQGNLRWTYNWPGSSFQGHQPANRIRGQDARGVVRQQLGMGQLLGRAGASR